MSRLNKFYICLVLIGILVLTGCSNGNSESTMTPTPETSGENTIDKFKAISDITKLVNSLTLKEKAVQMAASLEEIVPKKDAYTYEQDTVTGAIVFPDNDSLGVAGEEAATEQVGEYKGAQSLQNGARLQFTSVAVTKVNPLYSNAYTSYSSDYKVVARLGAAYVTGLAKAGIMPVLTGFIGAGYGKKDDDITLSEEEMRQQLYIYRRLLDAIQDENATLPVAIKVSSLRINNTRMTENKELVTEMLREVMKFDGIVMGAAADIRQSKEDSLASQVAAAINAGIDMISEPDSIEDYSNAIVQAVKDGKVTEERINEAVRRILEAKKAIGVLEGMTDGKKIETLSTKEASKLATSLVEKSLVLLENKDNLLPIKKNTTIYVTGPASNDMQIQCGYSLSEEKSKSLTKTGSTIKEALLHVADKYGYTIITDAAKAKEADVTLLCLGETPNTKPMTEIDTMSLTSGAGLAENATAINEAKKLGHPTITLLVGGRQLDISPYSEQWDAVVMCYLPGSRGDAIANTLAGAAVFRGKLTMPWYDSETEFTADHLLYGKGYGREY